MSVAFPAQMSLQMEGTPLATQQSVWSRPSKRQPSMSPAHEAHTIRSGMVADTIDLASQNVSMQVCKIRAF